MARRDLTGAIDFAYLESFAAGDAAMVEEVVSRVKAAARKAGLSADIAEPVWRTLIERCIAYEFEVWDQTRAD